MNGPCSYYWNLLSLSQSSSCPGLVDQDPVRGWGGTFLLEGSFSSDRIPSPVLGRNH